MTEAERHKALREAKKQMKAKYGIPCPECVAALPKAPPPRVLLPGELCKAHGYWDRRPRTPENDYQLLGSRNGVTT